MDSILSFWTELLFGKFIEQLAGQRAEIMFLGLNIAGSDGAPVRPVARLIN